LNAINFEFALTKDTNLYVNNWLNLHKKDKYFLYSNSCDLLLISGFKLCIEKDTNYFEQIILEYVDLGLKLKYFDTRLEYDENRFYKEIEAYFNTTRGILFKNKLNELQKFTQMDIDLVELFTTDQAIREYFEHWLMCLETDELEMEKKCNSMRHFDSLGFHKLIKILQDPIYSYSCYGYQDKIDVSLIHLFKYSENFKYSDTKSLQEFVDSLLKIKVLQGKFSNSNYGFLMDRPFGKYLGFNQIYGTHFGSGLRSIAADLVSPEKADDRRAEIFLPPLWQDALIDNFPLPEGYPLPEEAKVYFKDR
jgi:hypothetical protein